VGHEPISAGPGAARSVKSDLKEYLVAVKGVNYISDKPEGGLASRAPMA
jgi:hypothetical protein